MPSAERSDFAARVAIGLALVGLFALAIRWERPDGGVRPGEVDSAHEPHSLQLARAAERGRGRKAAAPTDIPWTGWKDILWRIYDGISRHRVLAVAASVVFYSLLAIVPAITAFVSFYGLFFSFG